MNARAPSCLLVAGSAGVLVGSGLAALATPRANDPCSDFRTLPEGSSSSSLLDLWPLGLRCEYSVGSRLVRSEFLGPTVAELYVWIAVATLIAVVALLKRDSAFVRGAAAAATLLAFSGAAWQFIGVQVVFVVVTVIGPPVVFGLDHLLRPAGARSVGASLRVAVALTVLALCAVFLVVLEPWFGIATGLLAGALASVAAARHRRSRGTRTASIKE